ncbi:MAG: DegT/DnrJ/EryC1/StrS family aminotransferase, partial [Deltaproteobacteria bacterium]|nr:DegT/DnrJ/EryC1/StrS family aminotransferase [Deltaproteobacteria bacterium]
AGLHLSLLVLGVGEGDEVIIPDYACTALLNAVKYVRATPRIVDIIPGEYNIEPSEVKKALSRHTKAIILVHSFGLPGAIKEIKSFGIPVIEDIAHAVGAIYEDGGKVGSLGDVCVVSFYATKVMTTGEGGMVLSDIPSILDMVRDLRSYDEKEDYRIRFNCKITDIQAAMGLIQLKRLSRFIEKRREIADYYTHALKDLPLNPPVCRKGHIYYRYVVEVDMLENVISHLHGMGVEAKRPVFKPLHRCLGMKGPADSIKAWERALSIPIYPSLTEGERETVVAAMKKALER